MTAVRASRTKASPTAVSWANPSPVAPVLSPAAQTIATILSESVIAIVLGLFTLFFVATRLRRPTFTIRPAHERIAAPVVGLVGGIFNGTIGVSGPILGSYLIALGVRPATFAFTIQVLFLAMTLVRLVGLVALGEVTPPLLAVGAILLVPSLVGQTAGFWLQARISQGAFERSVPRPSGAAGCW